MTTATGAATSEERHRDAVAADVTDVLAGFPPLTREQCDRVGIPWPRHSAAMPGTSPPRAA